MSRAHIAPDLCRAIRPRTRKGQQQCVAAALNNEKGNTIRMYLEYRRAQGLHGDVGGGGGVLGNGSAVLFSHLSLIMPPFPSHSQATHQLLERVSTNGVGARSILSSHNASGLRRGGGGGCSIDRPRTPPASVVQSDVHTPPCPHVSATSGFFSCCVCCARSRRIAVFPFLRSPSGRHRNERLVQ